MKDRRELTAEEIAKQSNKRKNIGIRAGFRAARRESRNTPNSANSGLLSLRVFSICANCLDTDPNSLNHQLNDMSPRSTQRGPAATKARNISRKDAKAAKKKKKYLSELGVLRALAGGISESDMVHVSENLRKLRKLSTLSVVRRSRRFRKLVLSNLLTSCSSRPSW